jgi:hypothetical protein
MDFGLVRESMMDRDEPYSAEDAWYTPTYFTIPVQRWLGGPINIQTNGPHEYPQKTWIGKASSGATKQAVFESLRWYPTPGGRRHGPVSDGDDTDIVVVPGTTPDKVKHYVFPEHFTIVNTTVKGQHRLHPGNVFRTVVQEGDDVYVVTRGYGTGFKYYPGASESTAPYLWRDVDQAIRNKFTPEPDWDYHPHNFGGVGRLEWWDLSQRPGAASPNPENSRRTSTLPTFNDRWDNLFPAATFDQRWDAIPDPALQTAQAWLDLSRNPASGNLNPTLSPSETPQKQEGRRLQDIGVQDIGVAGPQDQDLLSPLPLTRSAPPWLNLESTPFRGFRRPVLPNAPADVWKDAFVSPAMPGNFFPVRTMILADDNAPALDAPDGRSPIAQSATLDPVPLVPMKRLADLGRPYLGSASDDAAGGLREYDYRGFGDGEFNSDEFRRR